MTPRQKALLASSPSILLLLVTLGWNAWAYREQLVDRGIRILTGRT